MNYAWRDDAKGALVNGTLELDPTIDFDPDTHFWPHPELMNSVESDAIEGECWFMKGAPKFVDGLNALESEGIWVQCYTRQRVALDAELLLKSFPWDVQVASVVVESSTYDVNEVAWVAVGSVAQALYPPGGPGGITGWNIVASWAANSTHEYPVLQQAYASLKLALRLQRLPAYYITRYVWGVVFLVGMALMTFFVPGEGSDRAGLVQASFLGIVSWQFILVSSTPVTGYNTKLDNL